MSFKKNRQSILILCVLAIVLLFPFRNVSSQEGCGECPNPLVGVQELKIKGNIESITMGLQMFSFLEDCQNVLWILKLFSGKGRFVHTIFFGQTCLHVQTN
jgi:hypothetical protein